MNGTEFQQGLLDDQIGILQINVAHNQLIKTLPLHHRDQFDRMLIAQTQIDRLTIITADPEFSKYPVGILW